MRNCGACVIMGPNAILPRALVASGARPGRPQIRNQRRKNSSVNLPPGGLTLSYDPIHCRTGLPVEPPCPTRHVARAPAVLLMQIETRPNFPSKPRAMSTTLCRRIFAADDDHQETYPNGASWHLRGTKICHAGPGLIGLTRLVRRSINSRY